MSVKVWQYEKRGGKEDVFMGDVPYVGDWWNDSISSLEVASGYTCVAYQHADYGGDEIRYRGYVASMGKWDNKISSLRVIKDGEVIAQAFQDVNYGGYCWDFRFENYPDLLCWKGMISSIKILVGNYKLIAYRYAGYKGPFRVFDKSESSIGQFNDKISSVKIERASEANKVVATVYQDVSFGGWSQQLFEGTYNDLRELEMNKMISSVRINSGYQMIAYYDLFLQGKKCLIESELKGFLELTHNDKFQSLEVVKQAEATIYENRECGALYWGNFQRLTLGSYSDLSIFSMEKAVASIRVLSGIRVIAYAEKNNQGPFLVLESGAHNIGGQFPYGISSLDVAKASNANTVRAEIFTEESYGGVRQQILEGNYSDLTTYRMNKEISSIKTVSAYRVIAFVGKNFEGEFLVLDYAANKLGSKFNKNISSIQVVKASDANTVCAEIFTGTTQSGDSQQLFAGNYSDLDKYKMGNAVRSVKVNSGFRMIAYAEKNYGGPFLVFESGNSNINSQQFPYGILSLQVVKASDANTVRTDVFTGINQGGVRQQLFQDNYSDLSKYKMDKTISSLYIRRYFKVFAYAGKNYEDPFLVLESGVHNIGSQFAKKIASLQVVRASNSDRLSIIQVNLINNINAKKIFTGLISSPKNTAWRIVGIANHGLVSVKNVEIFYKFGQLAPKDFSSQIRDFILVKEKLLKSIIKIEKLFKDTLVKEKLKKPTTKKGSQGELELQIVNSIKNDLIKITDRMIREELLALLNNEYSLLKGVDIAAGERKDVTVIIPNLPSMNLYCRLRTDNNYEAGTKIPLMLFGEEV